MSFFEERMEMTYADKAERMQNQMGKEIYKTVMEKESNIVLALDIFDSTSKALSVLGDVGENICMVKTHIDAMNIKSCTEKDNFILKLQRLSKKYNFKIFEDRKFVDIGKTVKRQYGGGFFDIAEWSDVVNAHPAPGPGVIKGLYDVAKDYINGGKYKALIILPQMTPEGTLAKGEYTRGGIEMGNQFPEFVIGHIGAGSEPNRLKKELASETRPEYLLACPGVNKDVKKGDFNQRYSSPEDVINAGGDLLIIGSGMYSPKEGTPKQAAEEYQRRGWESYEVRQVA